MELKFNTGDWEYQGIDDITLLSQKDTDEIYNSIPNSNYQEWSEFTENLMKLFCEVLIEFKETELYQHIPKTKDFVSFCIDHDKDFEQAMERLKKYE